MTRVDLSVVGLGLVSPTATTPREHVTFIRAESALGTARAFVDEHGKPAGVIHCPWLGPALPLAERLGALGRQALGTALEPLAALPWMKGRRIPAMLCCSAPSESLRKEDVDACEIALAGELPLDFGARLTGEAGVFRGLGFAKEWLSAPGVPAVALVAVDSFVGLGRLEERYQRARRWERVAAYLSEAAAAIVVMEPGREGALRSLGRVVSSSTQAGSSSDEDDAIVDGSAMTHLLREAARTGARFTQSFGQHNVDWLRQRDFAFAVSRNKEAFDPLCRIDCVEDKIGRVGAAAGAAHLVYALATELHGAAPWGGGGALVAWAISRDGTRGLCVARGTDGGSR